MITNHLLSKVNAVDTNFKIWMDAEDKDAPEELVDKLYAVYHKSACELAEKLCDASDGMIDKKTAIRMAFHKRVEIAEIAKNHIA